MPLLNPNYISTLQVLYNEISGKYIILDNFEYHQVQDVEQLKFVQGTLGTHIMNIGGMHWKSTLQCPIFVFDKGTNQIEGPLDLVMNAISNPLFVLYPNAIPLTTIIMESATININESGIACTIQLLSDNSLVPIPFTISNNNPYLANDLIGRVARFYDTMIKIGNIESRILSGTINIKANIVKNYFLDNTSPPWPYLAVNGYDISGEVKVGYDMVAEEFDYLYINAQPNNLFLYHADSLFLSLGSYIFDFPTARSVYNVINKNISTQGIVNATVGFETYAPREIVG